MPIHSYLHNTLGYTNYEIAKIKFIVFTILSEISKLLLIGLFFFYSKKLTVFIMAAFVLCLLRISTGGLHFKHYLSCFLASFSIFFIGVSVLNGIQFTKFVQLITLLLCIIINYYCAPVVSSFRPIPDGIKIQRAKKQSIAIITAFSIILYIFPQNQYVNVGFWMIILQTIQLFAAKILKRRKTNEKKSTISCD